MDRRCTRLCFAGAMTLISLLWYAFGEDKGTVMDKKVQETMLRQAKELGADEKEAVKMAGEGAE